MQIAWQDNVKESVTIQEREMTEMLQKAQWVTVHYECVCIICHTSVHICSGSMAKYDVFLFEIQKQAH